MRYICDHCEAGAESKDYLIEFIDSVVYLTCPHCDKRHEIMDD